MLLRYLFLVLLVGGVGGLFVLRFDPWPTYVEGILGQPGDGTVERLLYRSLFSYGEEGEITPDLAKDYTVSPDGKVYEIVLKDAFWQDRRPVTATDVAFTFTRDPLFTDVTIEQEGEKEIRFNLKNALSSFPWILARPIVPAHFRPAGFDALGNTSLSLTEVKREGDVVKEIHLKNNGSGSIKNLVFKFFANEESLIKAAKRGEIDAVSSQSSSLTSSLSQLPITKGQASSLYALPVFKRYFAVFFNLDRDSPLLKDSEFRKLAAQKTPHFSGSPVKGPLSGTWAQADLPFPSFSQNPAPTFKGEITLTVPNVEELLEVANGIAESWKMHLGVEVKVVQVDLDQLDKVLSGRGFEAILLGQDVERDPDRYNLWHSSQKDFPGQNISGYANPRVDRALEEGRRVLAQGERKAHYANFQRLFLEDNPAVLVYHPFFNYWVSKKFSVAGLENVFSPEERFWDFQDWKLEAGQ